MASEAQAQQKKKVTPADYKEDVHNDWCPGCGDFGILNAVQMALADMELPNHKVAMFSGIGCSGKTPHYIKAYGVHTLHGRVLPFAQGAKLANPDLEVIAVGGDGDGLGIGAGHFVAAGRRNLDLTYIIHDNQVYGLTKGQASPTLPAEAQPKSLAQPNLMGAVNPLALALATGYTWIGRGYSYDIKNLKELIKQAVAHKGMAFLDIFQPCPTYNDINTKEWYAGAGLTNGGTRTYLLSEEGYDGTVEDPTNKAAVDKKKAVAFTKMLEGPDRLPLGVFYKVDLPTMDDRLDKRMGDYRKNPPAKIPIMRNDGSTPVDAKPMMDEAAVRGF